MSRLLTCSLLLALCVPAAAQEERIGDEPILPGSPVAQEAPTAAPAAAAGETQTAEDPVTVGDSAADGQTTSPEPPVSDDTDPKVCDPAAFPSEPRSVPGVIKTMEDAEGNRYPIVVVQPLALRGRPSTAYRNRAVEYTETLETNIGEIKEVRKYVREAYQTTALMLSAAPQSPVFVPLRANMPCFKLIDGVIANDAALMDLPPDTQVLVTSSLQNAMELAEDIQAAFNVHTSLTGLKPRLPEYILALETVAPADQQYSLTELLKDASPYRSSVTFFGELPLQADTTGTVTSMANYFEYPRDSDTAWSYARRAYFDGRREAAEPVLNSLIDSKVEEPLAYYLRGLMRYNRGDYQAAEKDFGEGARLEAVHGYSTQICRDLERVQGPARAALERQRRFFTR